MEALAGPDPELGNWGAGEGNKRLIELEGIPTFSLLYFFHFRFLYFII